MQIAPALQSASLMQAALHETQTPPVQARSEAQSWSRVQATVQPPTLSQT